jgi:hypothetical protein
VDSEEGVIGCNSVYLLSDPNLALFFVIVFLITDIHEIWDFETDNEEEIIRVGYIEKSFSNRWILLC